MLYAPYEIAVYYVTLLIFGAVTLFTVCWARSARKIFYDAEKEDITEGMP